MRTYKLIEVEDDNESVPSCLLARCEDPKKFAEQFQSVSFVTDLIKEELLHRINQEMDALNSDGVSDASLLRAAQFIKNMKEVLLLLP